MAEKLRVLILTADAGFGHRSAANAVSAGLEMLYGDQVAVDIVNPLDEKHTPALLRDSQSDYDRIIRKAPELYKLGYEASDGPLPKALMDRGLTVMLFEVMRDLLIKYKPAAIVSTYPLYQAPLSAVFSIYRSCVPLFTVVTDLATVHRIWFNDVSEKILVPTQLVADLALENEIPSEKISITGIPVNPQIALEQRSKDEIRRELGWEPKLMTILAVGSQRVEHLQDVIGVINHCGLALQLAVVAGKDDDLYTELQANEWHIPVQIYNFVDHMHLLMKASDLIVCKAGGLIVTEALACGLPMLLIDVIPGQETGNMEFVVDRGAGKYVQGPLETLETLYHLTLNDGALLREWSNNAGSLGKPQAALDIHGMVWEGAQRGSQKVENTAPANLLDLLNLNQIPWREDGIPSGKC